MDSISDAVKNTCLNPDFKERLENQVGYAVCPFVVAGSKYSCAINGFSEKNGEVPCSVDYAKRCSSLGEFIRKAPIQKTIRTGWGFL